MSTKPYVLALANLARGAGTTTLALGLAWTWGQSGRRVTFVDTSVQQTARLVALGDDGSCPWPNVQLASGRSGSVRLHRDTNLVLVDVPDLCDPVGQDWLAAANGLVLVGGVDIATARAVSQAASIIAGVRLRQPQLAWLGLALGPGRGSSSRAARVLREAAGDAFLSTPVPWMAELAQWPRRPGRDLPAARDEFLSFANELDQRLRASGNLAAIGEARA